MRKKYGVILAVIGYIVFFFCIEGWGVDWKWYEERDRIDSYYDAESITYPSKNVVRAWGKSVYKETKEYGISLVETNCAERKVRFLSLAIYYADGRVTSQVWGEKEAKWEYLIPGAPIESLFEILCKGQPQAEGEP